MPCSGMAKTALVLDDLLTHHRTSEGHPECPERLLVIRRALEPLKIPLVLPSSRAEPADIARLELLVGPSGSFACRTPARRRCNRFVLRTPFRHGPCLNPSGARP